MTGEDATSDRDGHGMGDERTGDTPGRRPARPEEPERGHERGDGSIPTGERPQGNDPAPDRKPPHAADVPDEQQLRSTTGWGDHTTSEPASSYDGTALEALLGAAIRGEKSDEEAERRAVAAFRAARDAGAHRARTRRRDDWRPRARRRGARSLRATLSVLLASLTLGGVAYAAIGSVGGGSAKDTSGDEDVRPSVSASPPAGSHGSARSSASAPAVRPPTAKDTLADCRAYEKLQGRGKALESTAFQRLVAAAGGEANVSAYCAARTGTATADASAAKPGRQKAKTSGESNADKSKSKKR